MTKKNLSKKKDPTHGKGKKDSPNSETLKRREALKRIAIIGLTTIPGAVILSSCPYEDYEDYYDYYSNYYSRYSNYYYNYYSVYSVYWD